MDSVHLHTARDHTHAALAARAVARARRIDMNIVVLHQIQNVRAGLRQHLHIRSIFNLKNNSKHSNPLLPPGRAETIIGR